MTLITSSIEIVKNQNIYVQRSTGRANLVNAQRFLGLDVPECPANVIVACDIHIGDPRPPVPLRNIHHAALRLLRVVGRCVAVQDTTSLIQ